MFRSQLFDHLQGVVFRASAVTTSLLVCVVKLFIWYVAVCCLCVCVPDVLVCGMFGCDKGGGSSTKHERRPPEDGQTIVTETCRVLIMFYKHF